MFKASLHRAPRPPASRGGLEVRLVPKNLQSTPTFTTAPHFNMRPMQSQSTLQPSPLKAQEQQ